MRKSDPGRILAEAFLACAGHGALAPMDYFVAPASDLHCIAARPVFGALTSLAGALNCAECLE
jgi:hypothetical protein